MPDPAGASSRDKTSPLTSIKEAKASTAEALWIPAVNNAGHWGRLAFLKMKEPCDAAHELRAFLVRRAAEAPQGATVNSQA